MTAVVVLVAGLWAASEVLKLNRQISKGGYEGVPIPPYLQMASDQKRNPPPENIVSIVRGPTRDGVEMNYVVDANGFGYEVPNFGVYSI